MQFSRGTNFDEVRRNFGGGLYSGMFVDDGMGMGMDMGDSMSIEGGSTAAERESRMAQSKEMLPMMAQIAAAINSPNPAEQLQGLNGLSKALSFVEVIRTPQQRYAFKEDIQVRD